MGTRKYKIFCIAGQSNASGNNAGGAPTPVNGYEKPAGVTAILSDDKTLAHSFCNEYVKIQGVYAPLITNRGSGGSDILDNGVPGTNWAASPAGTLYDGMVTDINSLLTYYSDADLGGIFWLQGEKNANRIDTAEITKADYKAGLEDLASRIATDFPGVNLYIIRTGKETTGDTTGYQEVRAAQDEVAAAVSNVVMAYTDTVNFQTYGWMYDSVHYSQVGQNNIGFNLARFIS